MKELKFRRYDDYGFVFFDLVDFRKYDETPFVVQKSPIEQYTGLKDKNGKEIYEGDIIRCHGDDRFIAPVIRHAKSGGFCWASCYDEICFIPESDEVEVIGNIHENSELLRR